MRHYKTVVMDNTRWTGFEHRPGDIVISTPPKCGTTWMQMIVALLVFDGPRFPATLDVVSPWLDMCNRSIEDVRADLDAQTHRRFVKTHTPLDGLPLRDDVTYVVVGRDPRDVAISFEHHRSNMDLDRFLEHRRDVMGLDDIAGLHAPTPMTGDDTERTRAFVHGDTFGTLGALLHHLDDAWRRRATGPVVMVHYADLDADLPAEMLRVATTLGFGTSPERIAELASHATFTAMPRPGGGARAGGDARELEGPVVVLPPGRKRRRDRAHVGRAAGRLRRPCRRSRRCRPRDLAGPRPGRHRRPGRSVTGVPQVGFSDGSSPPAP